MRVQNKVWLLVLLHTKQWCPCPNSTLTLPAHPSRDDLRLHFSLARPQFVTRRTWQKSGLMGARPKSTRVANRLASTHTTQLLRYFLCKQPRRAADSTRVFLAHYRRWGGELVSLFSISPPAHSRVPLLLLLPVIFRAVCTSIRGAARDRRQKARTRERKRRANFANELDSCCIFHLLPADAALWEPKTN